VKLGQQVFMLSSTGEVVRTMVGKIWTGYGFNNFEPRYILLNGESGQHWFSYQDALTASQDRVSQQIKVLKKQLATLRMKSKRLVTEEARDAVMNAPYKVVDLRDCDVRGNTRKLMRITVPETYPKIGDVMYLVITSQVMPKEFVYRPFKHFVLESIVRSVCFSPDGKVHIEFKTPFRPEEYFVLREDAESRLRSYLKTDTNQPLHFVSHATEVDELDKIEDIPF
jgi:hypothetical protein